MPLMISKSGKISWKIKQEDFINGNFDEAKFKLGYWEWSLYSDGMNPLDGDNLHFEIELADEDTSEFVLSASYDYGTMCLIGVNASDNLMVTWDKREVTFKVDTSVLSFDALYLFPDGTYHFEFVVHVNGSTVDFSSPNHDLLLNAEDAGCLQIDDRRIFVSKSNLSIYSPYFKGIFFADSRDREQDVIVLEDVKFEQFMEFLAHLYVSLFAPTNADRKMAAEVLKLANMSLCDLVTDSCEQDLARQDDSRTVVDLELADQYNLPHLRNVAISELPIAVLKTHLEKILNKPECLHTRFLIMERLRVGSA